METYLELLKKHQPTPNYQRIVDAAFNKKTDQVPLYDHDVHFSHMEKVLGLKFGHLMEGNFEDKKIFFKHLCYFYKLMGYDVVIMERWAGQAMPGSGALAGLKEGVIKNRQDFNDYPWDKIPKLFFERYEEDYMALKAMMPTGMKALGGVGNGVFECVQDIVGFTQLSYISIDDPELYKDLFEKVGDMLLEIWDQLIDKYDDVFCVYRIGDDLGFKSTTLISPVDIQTHIVPQYKRIVARIKETGKPFLLHSCGSIFDVMDDFINEVGINAKHSNEDQIAPFMTWVEKYGDRIANFGGIDTDRLCSHNTEDLQAYIVNLLESLKDEPGIAIGSGNSIPDYVDLDKYLIMNETVRRYRGDFN